MSGIFAPKDIESLSKIAALLAVPFFGAALFVDFGLWILRYDNPPILGWFVSSSWSGVRFAAQAATFLIGIGVVAITYEVSNWLLLHVPKFMFFVGLSLLSFGVLGMGQLTQPTHFGAVNLFWHLGALCWGLHIFAPTPSK